MPSTSEEKYFASQIICSQNHSKLSQNREKRKKILYTHQYNNASLLRQETQKIMHVLKACKITIEKKTLI